MPPSSRRKARPTPSSSSSSRTATSIAPSTPDDALALGVELESAGDKWRAGDANKALRFYARAEAAYAAGLARWPQAKDLAFNV